MKLKLSIFSLIIVLFFSCDDTGLTVPTKPPTTGGDTTQVLPFNKVPTLDEMAIYEVNLRAFSQSGTFEGVKQRLDELEKLHINVIWLMPIHPIGAINSVNSPYSVQDYEKTSPEYGSLNNFIDLVNEAHSRDIAVIIDWVANHTAWDHPWITNKSWYAQDGSGNIISPPGTGWTDVAELDFSSTEMRQAMIQDMKFWVEKAGVDGFRCDAVDFVPTDFWSQAISSINSSTSKKLIWLAEGGKAENFSAGFQFNYSWDYYSKIKDVYADDASASGLFVTNTQEFNAVPANKSKLRYITNHDIYAWDETPDDIFTNEGSVGAFAATIFMAGVPLIYTGQEVGNPGNISFFGKNPINWNQNPDILSQYQKLMSVRSQHVDLLFTGELKTFSNTNALFFERSKGDEKMLVLVNTRGQEITVTLPEELKNTDWTNTMDDATISLDDQVELSAYEYLVLTINN